MIEKRAGNQIRPKEFEVFPALFPNVSCFTLILLSENSWEYYGNEYPEAVSSLPKFDHIRQLNLAIEYKHSPLLILERLLSTYGQNLQTLNLTCKFPSLKIDLAIILKNCPKLEKLSLVKICLQKSTLPIAVFTELKDLELRYPHLAYYLSYPRYEEETMILSNILSAPKLEKKQILSRLHTFHFYLNCYANERLKYLTNFLKTACAFLPKLSDFRIGRRINFDHPLLTCAIRTDDKVFDECIRSLLQLMENEK
ncbi:Hypothetical predicted protein [Cloeon dipterum]|uniref:F-box domain-containing protein n=1 Tax=Cloeon dipterum TaxID=197152 RepID=A0A8S1D3R0_9INSE|nr:Hypothetical predicted protein [Cloeon dipterum]